MNHTHVVRVKSIKNVMVPEYWFRPGVSGRYASGRCATERACGAGDYL